MSENRLLFNVPAEEYHSMPGISNTLLKWFRKSPRHFKEAREGRLQIEPTEAQNIGTFVHSLILEGRKDYAVHPAMYPCEPTAKDPRTQKPWTLQANYCKQWEAQQDAPCISQEEADQIEAARSSVINHGYIGKLFTEGKPEVCGFARCPRTGLLLKARFDYLKTREIVDLKKSFVAETGAFARAIARNKYAAQAAHYSYVAKLIGMDIVAFYFVAVELEPIPMPNCVLLSTTDLEIATEALYRTLEKVAECEAENHWPGYCDDQPNLVNLPAYAHDLEEEPIDLTA